MHVVAFSVLFLTMLNESLVGAGVFDNLYLIDLGFLAAVLSVCAELSFGPDGVKPTAEATSVAKRIEDELDAPVVAGLHSLAAANLAAAPPEEDAFVCGDDESAKQLALELAGRLVSGRAVDCGPLASARALEGMTAVIVNVNKRYKAHAGLRVTGLF